MERIWLKSYRADVPAEADVDAFSSIVNVVFGADFRALHERQAMTFKKMGTGAYGLTRQ